MFTVIHLEDNGQDFLQIYTDSKGVIVRTEPFQTSVWKGGVIPIHAPGMVEAGKPLPIHKPPHINYGFLKHKIERIEKVEKI